MIKEIQKPNIDFKFWFENDCKFYYDEENKEYFIEDENNNKFYFNLNGYVHRFNKPAVERFNGVNIWIEDGKEHRLDGPSYINRNLIQFWINNHYCSEKYFAKKTNHLICKFCGQFCKQGCF